AEWGVHRRAVPADFTPATFDALLALGDAEPAQKLLALPADERTALLELPGEVLAKLAAVEPVADLDWLAGYLLLPGQQPQTIAEEVVEGKVTVAELRGPAPRVEPTATLLPVEAALTPVTMATLSETNPGEQSSALPSLLLVLLLLVGAA
ncbi:MAG: hypothetical protein KDE01_22120, partial [Caldilineaceae bacterium]|nr:hypothetical protein [Caldilineaceae bacterium]